MQLSRFVIVYRDAGAGEHVLYSVLNGRHSAVDTGTLEAIGRWTSGSPPRGRSEAALAEALRDKGILATSREEDDAALRTFLDGASEGLPGTMYVTLIPALARNLHRMSTATEMDAVRFILDRTAAAGCRKLVVQYAHGEALTRKDFILRTASAFRGAMRATGGEFAWELTAIEVHIDLPFVKALMALGEGSLKLTLDADRENRDRQAQGPSRAAPVNEEQPAGPHAGISRCNGCTTSTQSAETLIRIDTLPHSQTVGEREAPSSPCELHWKNSYTVDPDGGVYKCPAVAGRPEMAIGNVRSHVKDKRAGDKHAPLLRYRPWEQCGDCKFMPVCMGGCLGGQYLTTGRLDQVDCRKPEFEAAFRQKISRVYETELSRRDWVAA